jgi:DHA2 family multidrug resistance protein
MSATEAQLPQIVSRNRPLMIVGVMGAMVLQTLDTTIANVALPYMRASLGATQETISWVLTSYVMASAVAMPMAGWLVDRVGVRRLMLFSVVLFTAASMLCGAAQTLEQMVLFRILQGLAGAFLGPLAQTVILDSSTPAERPKMMSIYVQGALMGPIMGPIIGGYLTDNYNWRWVFYVNLPLGVLCILLLLAFLPDTPRRSRRFDLTGLLLVATALCAMQLILDRGVTKDWFASGEIVIYAVIAVSALWMVVVHHLTTPQPLFPVRLFRDPNFVVGLLFIFLVGVVAYGSMGLLPGLLQDIYGYPAVDSGILLASRGIGMFVAMTLFGSRMGKIDPRIAGGSGLILTATSVHMMTYWSVDMPSWPITLSGMMQGVGLAFMFLPLNLISFATLPSELRTDATSLSGLARNLGSSFGIAAMIVMLSRTIQTSHAEIGESITRQSIPLEIDRLAALGGMSAAPFAVVDGMVNRQAAMIGYLNDFQVVGYLCFAALPFLLLVRVKPVVSTSVPVGASADLGH